MSPPLQNAFEAPVYLKWLGRKTSLLPRILQGFSDQEHPDHFVEPFVGSGAVSLALREAGFRGSIRANDLNLRLSYLHRHVAYLPEVLWAALPAMDDTWRERYGSVRDAFNEEFYFGPGRLADGPVKARTADIHTSAQLLWLNATCFNGLYRENKAGAFNVPVGRYTTPRWPKKEKILAASRLWNLGGGTTFTSDDFEKINLDDADFNGKAWVYCDPPYVPAGNMDTAFTAYQGGGFSYGDHVRLAAACKNWAARGHRVVVSNHDTPLARLLYPEDDGWEVVDSFSVRRSVAAKSTSRKAVNELLVAIGPKEG